MSKSEAPDTGLVHLYPDPYHFIDGEAATERDVTPAEARRLLAYSPPAFHREKPALAGPLTQPLSEAAAIPEPAVVAEPTATEV